MARQSAAAFVEVAPVRFALSDVEAAAAIGVSSSLFRQMVEDGRMPRPKVINARRVWDVDEVRAAFKRLPSDGAEPDLECSPFSRVVT